jgi:hypothetical protein
MYVRPAHFDMPKVDLLTKSTANQYIMTPQKPLRDPSETRREDS